MRKTLLTGSALALLLALAACGDRQSQVGQQPSAAPRPAPVQREATPEPKAATETASFTAGEDGAYGMPRAPIPYDQLSRYEQRQEPPGERAPQDDADNTSATDGAAPAKPQAYREPAKRQNPKTRRESDMVFY